MKSLSKSQPPSGIPLFQLKITLKWSKPSIWRRVVVRSDMTLERLHYVIQIAMGWTNSHMHQFIVGSGMDLTFYGRPNPGTAGTGRETQSELRHRVRDLARKEKSKFYYEYDFGDSWMHEVVVEKVLPPDPTFKYPVCLTGANACPPEDCGGLGGYYDMLAILTDPKHPEYEEYIEWIGGEHDPSLFSSEEVNADLKRI